MSGKKEDDPLHDGRTIPDINPHDGRMMPDIDPHDGNTIIEPPLREGAFEEVAPASPAEKPATAPPPTRKRLAGERGTKVRRTGTAVREVKPPSKIGKTIKKALFFGVPLLIVGLVAAGFFVRDGNDDIVWVALLKNFGIMKDEAKPKKAAPEREPHEMQVRFDGILKNLNYVQDQLDQINKQLAKGEWTKESAQAALGNLETQKELVDRIDKELTAFETWYRDVYLKNHAAYEEARKAGDKEKMKQLDAVLERAKYKDIEVKDQEITGARNQLISLRNWYPGIRSGFPSREEIAAGKLPGKTGSGASRVDTPRGDPKKEFDVSRLNRYAGITAGTWLRKEHLLENLAMGTEVRKLVDSVFSAVEKDHAVQQTFIWFDERETTQPDEKIVFADRLPRAQRSDKVKIQGAEHECAVVEYQGGVLVWILRDGPLPDRLSVRIEGTGLSITATEVGEKTLKVKDREIRCAFVELKGKSGDKETIRRYWYSTNVPTWIVREEEETPGDLRRSSQLVDYGASARAPFSSTAAKKDDPRKDDPKKDPDKKPTLPKMPAAWAGFEVGTWLRLKTTRKQGPTPQEFWDDTILVKVEGDEAIFRNEHLLATGEVTSAERRQPLQGTAPTVVGEDKVEVAGVSIRCVVAERDGLKMWIAAEGPAMGCSLRTEGKGTWTTVVRIGEDQIVIAGEGFTCFTHETVDSSGAKAKYWSSSKIPGMVGRSVIEKTGEDASTTVTEVVAFGKGAKPPFPGQETTPPRDDGVAKDKTAEELEAAADAAVEKGKPASADVLRAYRAGLPADKEQLRALKEKAESAETNMKAAVDGYALAKARGADAERMEERIARLQKILALLRKCREAIEAELAK
ncbi:MAG: hypothetical protein HYY17_02200 [Planctomycetes bacterium]|nr:hypothetical protein [Planctomycetota bacterium]